MGVLGGQEKQMKYVFYVSSANFASFSLPGTSTSNNSSYASPATDSESAITDLFNNQKVKKIYIRI